MSIKSGQNVLIIDDLLATGGKCKFVYSTDSNKEGLAVLQLQYTKSPLTESALFSCTFVWNETRALKNSSGEAPCPRF